MKETKEAELKKTFETKNEEAGLHVVRTAIKTMKLGGGSMDFMAADLDLLFLTPGVIYAVKNNSRTRWFDLRDSRFELVSRNIAVSLDKVTVHHTSYMVIVTYFFWAVSCSL